MSSDDNEMDFDFRDQIQNTDWYPLEIHHKNGALFIVSHTLDLSAVAKAVANDETQTVKNWLDEALIARPEESQIEQWRQDPYRQIGRFIIVAPYVFVQLHQMN